MTTHLAFNDTSDGRPRSLLPSCPGVPPQIHDSTKQHTSDPSDLWSRLSGPGVLGIRDHELPAEAACAARGRGYLEAAARERLAGVVGGDKKFMVAQALAVLALDRQHQRQEVR